MSGCFGFKLSALKGLGIVVAPRIAFFFKANGVQRKARCIKIDFSSIFIQTSKIYFANTSSITKPMLPLGS